MPAVITASDLRSVLGVSSSLYNDAYLNEIIETAEGVIIPLLKTLPTGQYYADVPQVASAVLAVSVEVFQSRMAPGGQIEGVDFTASPYRLGRSLFNRVSGLLGAYIDVDSIIA